MTNFLTQVSSISLTSMFKAIVRGDGEKNARKSSASHSLTPLVNQYKEWFTEAHLFMFGVFNPSLTS